MSGLSISELDIAFGGNFGEAAVDASRPPRFRDEDADCVTRRDSPWLVKGLWPRVGVCFVAGPSGCGKSFWIIDQASRIAKGQDVLGRRSTQSGTIYVAAEGANGVRARFEGLRNRVGPWGGRIRVISEAPILADQDDVRVLKHALTRIADDMTDRGDRVGLVVIDTLSASMAGVDENAGKDMGQVLQALHDLATSMEACIVAVAHTGKDVDRGIRGWSGQVANADGVIMFLAPDADSTRTGIVFKVKDGEAGDRFAFGLESVDLGTDVDGDPVTTCVVAERDTPVRSKSSARSSGPGAQADMILGALDCLSDKEADLSHLPNVPHGTKGLPLDIVRAKTFEMGLQAETEPSADDEPAAMSRWKSARKKAFQRGLERLEGRKMIKREGKHIWRP